MEMTEHCSKTVPSTLDFNNLVLGTVSHKRL